MGKNILSRIKQLEKHHDNEQGPVDLYGKHYDSLPRSDRWRWWEYNYNGRVPFDTLAECESFELRTIRDSLHFVCERIMSIDEICDIPELKDLDIQMSRKDFLQMP